MFRNALNRTCEDDFADFTHYTYYNSKIHEVKIQTSMVPMLFTDC